MSKNLQKTLAGALATMSVMSIATPVMATTVDIDALYKNAYDALMALDSKQTTAEMFANAKSAFEAAPAGLVQKPGSNGTGSSSNGTVSNGAVATGDTVNVSALAGLFLSLLMIAAFMKRKTFLGSFEKDE